MMPEANDPTRAGAPVPKGKSGTAQLSLTEIETLCMKAARGAGMSWGMAEEAGFAARWLAAEGVAGVTLLLAHLERAAGARWTDIAPVIAGRTWAAPGAAALSPIAVGAALCDRAELPEGPASGKVRIGPVGCPALVLPFAAQVARHAGGTYAVAWDGCRAVVSNEGLLSVEGAEGLTADACDALTLSPCGGGARIWRAEPSRGIDFADLRALDAFALRTTVPASERSRQGAGAGTVDND